MVGQSSSNKAAALLILLPALLTFVIVWHHPVLARSDLASGAALDAGIGRIGTANARFHGFLLLLVVAQALGFATLADRLGLSSLWTRAGLVFYGLGTILMMVPLTFDGFVTPLLGTHCVGTPALCAQGLASSLTFEWAAIQAFTRIALLVQALGLFGWSIRILCMADRIRWAGLGGIAVSAAPLVLLGAWTHPIDPARLGQITLFDALWALGAAGLLWTDRFALQRP